MASRNFNRAQNLEKEVKSLYADVAIGATGAPTLTKGLGIASIARTGAGAYDITLEDKYVRLMHVSFNELDSTSEDITFQLTAETVSTTKVVSFVTKAAAVDTDPQNGSRILIKVDVKNSSVGE